MDINELFKKILSIGDLTKILSWKILKKERQPLPFPGSERYWENRYKQGGSSGGGSSGQFAEFKAEIINNFVTENGIESVIDFGCGDGNQLKLANYKNYIGLDVSKKAIAKCQDLFKMDPSKKFKLMEHYDDERADLAISLDVIYQLVEDEIYENYMTKLFDSSNKYVIIYSSNTNDNAGYEGTHVRHRKFTDWVTANKPNGALVQHIPNRHPYEGDEKKGSFSEFYVYQKPAVSGNQVA